MHNLTQLVLINEVATQRATWAPKCSFITLCLFKSARNSLKDALVKNDIHLNIFFILVKYNSVLNRIRMEKVFLKNAIKTFLRLYIRWFNIILFLIIKWYHTFFENLIPYFWTLISKGLKTISCSFGFWKMKKTINYTVQFSMHCMDVTTKLE